MRARSGKGNMHNRRIIRVLLCMPIAAAAWSSSSLPKASIIGGSTAARHKVLPTYAERIEFDSASRKRSGLPIFATPSSGSDEELSSLSVGAKDTELAGPSKLGNVLLSALTAIAVFSILFGTSISAPAPVFAADDATATVYKSGKAPAVPGQKPKSKDDLKGTKKDPNFLRSISDCKNQCQNTLGPDGLSRPKEDCLSDCQDICCTTYEQCTFAITPRL